MCLSLRSDLRFTPHFEGGEKCYLIEDPVRSQFFRVGIAEYLLISMFDGKTSVGDALVRLSKIKGDYALTEGEAVSICKWLVDSELACTPESSGARRLSQTAVDRAIRKRLGAWNPLCLKVPLAYPDRFFAAITPTLRHLFGSAAAIAGMIIGLIAIYRISAEWDQFVQASSGVFSPGRWIWMAVCWVVLKIIHESAHAIVCRKYGGSVHEAGAIFVLFAPLAYVDLTSSWRFRSKWQRIHTAAAGVYIELLAAAVAAIFWSATQPGLINDLCFNVVVMASLTSIVFNANPLMRFDGYYILSDLLEIPNLYADGQQYLKYVGRRYILGEHAVSALRYSKRDLFTRLYGIAAFCWRIFICVSMVIAAAMLFHGLGMILAAAAIVLWVGVPIARMLKYVCRRDALHRRRQTRLAISTSLVMLMAYCALGIGWPGAMRAPAIVQYEPLAFVRASSPGFVQALHVKSGQRVETGDPIGTLENRELVTELRDIELSIEQSLLKSRVFKQSDEMHSYLAEMEQLRSLKEKREQKARQVNDLVLRAPVAGRVVARNLSLLLGTYLDQGDELAAIGDESRKELKVAISQSDFDQFKAQLGRSINARISGGYVLSSQLVRVDPRAQPLAPDESMYAVFGGPLESRAKKTDDGQADGFELLTPHFTGAVRLDESQSRQVRVGQRGTVWFGRNQRTLGSYLSHQLRMSLPTQFRWVEDARLIGAH